MGGALFQGSGGGLGGGGQRHVDRFVLLGSKFQSDSMYAHTHKINLKQKLKILKIIYI